MPMRTFGGGNMAFDTKNQNAANMAGSAINNYADTPIPAASLTAGATVVLNTLTLVGVSPGSIVIAFGGGVLAPIGDANQAKAQLFIAGVLVTEVLIPAAGSTIPLPISGYLTGMSGDVVIEYKLKNYGANFTYAVDRIATRIAAVSVKP